MGIGEIMPVPPEVIIASEVSPRPSIVAEASRFRELIQTGKQFAVRGVLALAITPGIVAAETVILDPALAYAESGGYPDADAAVYNLANYDW